MVKATNFIIVLSLIFFIFGLVIFHVIENNPLVEVFYFFDLALSRGFIFDFSMLILGFSYFVLIYLILQLKDKKYMKN